VANPDFTGVILAGGASRRMGTDKAMLRVNDKSLLEITRRLLLDAGAKRIVVLGRSDIDHGIADKYPGQGPVVAAMQYLENQTIGSKHLFVPVDMPALSFEILRPLALEAYWAHHVGNNMPFLAIADGIALAPPKRLYELLTIKMARRLPLATNNRVCFSNLNTPKDFTDFVNESIEPAPNFPISEGNLNNV